MKHRNLFVGLFAASALTLAGCATGPDRDQVFADFLAGEGVTVTSTDTAVTGAHQICTKLGNGQTLLAVLFETGAANPNWTPEQAGVFTGASIGMYCSEHAPASVS